MYILSVWVIPRTKLSYITLYSIFNFDCLQLLIFSLSQNSGSGTQNCKETGCDLIADCFLKVLFPAHTDHASRFPGGIRYALICDIQTKIEINMERMISPQYTGIM